MPDNNYNILYVDDDEINLRAFENNFQRDFDVIKSSSAKEGLKILAKRKIKVIVSDQRMPEVTGIEFLKEVKNKYPKVKRIILTAYTDNIVLKEAINEEILWWYTNKPYNYENFKAVLKKALETYDLETDKENLKDELVFRKEMLEKMMDTAMDAIITADDNKKILMANQAAEKLFDYKSGGLLGNPLNMLIPEVEKTIQSKYIKSFKNDKEPLINYGRTFKVSGRTSKGKQIPIETSLSRQKMGAGYYYHAFMRDISARLNAENKLNESESKLKEAQRIALIGHWTYKTNTKKFLWSDEMYRIFGITPRDSEETSDFFYNRVHPDDRDSTRRSHYDSLETKQPLNINYRLKLPDGQIKYVNEKCITEYDKQGKPFHSTGTIQDITQQKEAEIALKRSEEKFKSFTESLKISVLLIQGEKIHYANNECGTLLEYTKNELYNLAATEYIHPDNIDLVTKNYRDRLEDKPVDSQYEIKVVSKSGKIKDVVVTAAKIDFQDKPAILVAFLDITNKKQIQKKLIISEERFKLAMEGASDGLWDWNVETNEVYFSPRWKSMLGYKYSEIENNFDSWTNLIHPDDLQTALQNIDNFKKKLVKKFEIEFRMKHKDGNFLNILSRAFGIRSKSGEVIRIVGTHVDITESKQVEEKIKNLNQNLEQLVKNRTEELTLEKDFSNNIVNSLPGIFSLIDMKGNHIRWNKNHEEVTGYSGKEYKDMTAFDFFSKTSKKNIIKEIIQLEEKGEINLEIVLLTKSGEEIPYFFSGVKIIIDNQQYVAGTAIDISIRKKAEAELLEKTTELEIFNKAMIDRELRIIEMKEEVNKLSIKLGKKPPYIELWKDNN